MSHLMDDGAGYRAGGVSIGHLQTIVERCAFVVAADINQDNAAQVAQSIKKAEGSLGLALMSPANWSGRRRFRNASQSRRS